jgi:hypothetical protein
MAHTGRILAEIDRAADEIVQFTVDLVRIPTIRWTASASGIAACTHCRHSALQRVRLGPARAGKVMALATLDLMGSGR